MSAGDQTKSKLPPRITYCITSQCWSRCNRIPYGLYCRLFLGPLGRAVIDAFKKRVNHDWSDHKPISLDLRLW